MLFLLLLNLIKLLPLFLLANFAYAETIPQTAIDKAIAVVSQKTDERQKELNAAQAKLSEFEKQENIRLAELAKKPDVKIGMSKSQVINQSNWGEPKYINRTVTKHGTHEQWVYSEYRYLYFDNGRLTVIQD